MKFFKRKVEKPYLWMILEAIMGVLMSDQKAWFYCKYNLIIESENKTVRVYMLS